MNNNMNTEKKKRTFKQNFELAIFAVLLILFMFLCLPGGLLSKRESSHIVSPQASVIPPEENTTTPAFTAVKSRCVPASARQFENISAGVADVQSSNNVSTAWAVKSNDFENIWFVAAEIQGPGIKAGEVIGLWAISGDPDNPGLTLSVNGAAKQFSPYPDGSTTDAQTSLSDDGAQEALYCVR